MREVIFNAPTFIGACSADREKIIATCPSLRGRDPRNRWHPATKHLPPHPPFAIPIKFSTVDMGPGGLKAIKIMIYGAVLGSNCVRATELGSTLLIAWPEGECNTFLSHDQDAIVRMKTRDALPPSGRLSHSLCASNTHISSVSMEDMMWSWFKRQMKRFWFL